MTTLVIMVITGSALAGDLYWSGTGTWDTATASWGSASGGPYDTDTWVNATDANAIFEDTAGTVTLGEPITAGGLTFDKANYVITGTDPNTLTLGGAGVITANANATISASLAGNVGITKDGSGTLTLSGVNTYTGGTVIDGGKLTVSNDTNLGNFSGGLSFTGTSELYMSVTSASFNRDLTLNDGVVATFRSSRNNFFTATNAITGTGGVTLIRGSGWTYLTLSSTANTFTGPITAQGGDRAWVIVNSLGDGPGAGAITLQGGAGKLTYDTGAISPLVLDYRQVAINPGGGTIENKSSFPMTINTDLLANGTGTLTLSGNGGGAFNGNIADGNGAVIGLTCGGGNWTLSGTNTYSGTTYARGGTLTIQGAQALPASSTVLLSEYSSNFKILDDGTGAIDLGNTITTRSQQTSAGAIYKIFVGNNSTANGGNNPASSTTGSTIVLGNFSYATVADNRANGLTLNVYGDNNYRLQLADVELNVIQRGNQMFNPTTAPLTIAGTVKQVNGKAEGAYTGCDTLVLKGTATGNLVSGAIMDADDYTDLSNPNAVPLNVTKAGTGEWTLSGTNTYTGVTTVSGGTLNVTGSINNSDVTVSNADTKIAGGGSVNGLMINAGAGFIWSYGDGGDHVMDVNGDMVLDDNWVLKLVDLGNDPVVSTQYNLFTYGGAYTGSSEFSNDLGNIVIDATEAPDWTITDLTVTAGGGFVRITGIGVVSSQPGDFNLDTQVEQTDLNLLLSNWGASSVPAEWTAAFDGLVDQSELNELLSNWGVGVPGADALGAAETIVPEPATMTLLVLGGLAAIRRRK